MSVDRWFVLDEVGDQVLLLSPDEKFVVGRVIGRLGGRRAPRRKAVQS